MPQIRLEPLGINLNVPTNVFLLHALAHAKVNLSATCQGKGLCSTCALQVLEGKSSLTAMTAQEELTHKKFAIDSGYRLTCQVQVVEEGLVLQLDSAQSKKLQQILERLRDRIAPQAIYHPITKTLLVSKGQIISQNCLEQLLSL